MLYPFTHIPLKSQDQPYYISVSGTLKKAFVCHGWTSTPAEMTTFTAASYNVKGDAKQ